MKSTKWGFAFVVLALSILLSTGAARADLYWESENVASGMPGQQAGTKISKHYFSEKGSRAEMGDGTATILDFETMTAYQLDLRAKTYTRMDLDKMMPEKLPGKDGEQAAKMMGAMAQIQVTPTGETKTINGYACKKYNVAMMMMNSEYWVTKDVKGFDEMKAISAKMAGAMAKNPMLAKMDISGMMTKLDGFPIQTNTRAMGGTVMTTVRQIEQKKLDPGLFKVPGDFVQKKM